MKTVKLSCASCGAPIAIPEDVDTVVCPSCQSTLAVDRGEGYVTLKVIEKLAKSIQDMGEMTSSAIKENAYVTQVELKRMQLNQLISMEEMKINSLQAEIRAVRRRMSANTKISAELTDLLLQENDVRMHIRSLKADVAHLDPGWEESLEVIRRDGKLIDEAIACLAPCDAAIPIQNRLVQMHQEKRRNTAAFNALEAKLLRKEIDTVNYPPFDQLTLEQMEELMTKIPGDLIRLEAGEQTPVREKMHADLDGTLQKIKSVYPRRKLESQTGPLPSLNFQSPYPEAPEALQPLINQVKADLEKVAAIPEGPVKTQYSRALNEKLKFLTSRAAENIPTVKARKRKRRVIVTLSILGAVFVVSLIISLAVIGAANRKDQETQEQGRSNILSDQDQALQELTTIEEVASGEYEEYVVSYVEVTVNTTYLRDEPSLDAGGTVQVMQGDLLVDISDSNVPDQWYWVTTWDGSETGYLAIDWVVPITVRSTPGDALPTHFTSTVDTVNFSSWDSQWPEESYDDEIATNSYEYRDGVYELTITANSDFIYTYANQPVANLAEEYLFSLSVQAVDYSGDVYYGLQTNVIDDSNFDAVMLSPEGDLRVFRVRDGYFKVLYNKLSFVNTMIAYDPQGINTFSVVRQTGPAGSGETYQYAINGKVFAEVELGKLCEEGTSMGAIVFLDQKGAEAIVRIDDFTVSQ